MRSKLVLAVALLLAAAGGFALQRDKKGDEPAVRSVQGAVRDVSENLVEGAVVQLKNTRTLQVRSFITQGDGNYHFHGLSTSVDYELKAEHNGLASAVRRLSTFDSRRTAVINLKLEAKK